MRPTLVSSAPQAPPIWTWDSRTSELVCSLEVEVTRFPARTLTAAGWYTVRLDLLPPSPGAKRLVTL